MVMDFELRQDKAYSRLIFFWMRRQRWRVTVYFSSEEELKALEKWAEEENRSISNLAHTILINAIATREASKGKGDKQT